MERLEAFRALFGDAPDTATQEHVDLLKGKLALTDDEIGALEDEIVDRATAFADDSETYLEKDSSPQRAALLKGLAAKVSFTHIVPAEEPELSPSSANSMAVDTPDDDASDSRDADTNDPPDIRSPRPHPARSASLATPLRAGAWNDPEPGEDWYDEPDPPEPDSSPPSEPPASETPDPRTPIRTEEVGAAERPDDPPVANPVPPVIPPAPAPPAPVTTTPVKTWQAALLGALATAGVIVSGYFFVQAYVSCTS